MRLLLWADIVVGSSTGLLVSKLAVNIGANALETLGELGERDKHVVQMVRG